MLNVIAHDNGSYVEGLCPRLSTPGPMCASSSPIIKIRVSSTILGCCELCTESFAGMRRGSNRLLVGSSFQFNSELREEGVP